MGTIRYYIWETLVSMLPAIPAAILLRLLAIPLRRRKGLASSFRHEAGTAALLLWISAVLVQTLGRPFIWPPVWLNNVPYEINLIPFYTIREMFAQGATGYAAVNLLGNVLIFAPIGLLPALLWRRMDCLWPCLGAGFGFSLFIEAAQLFSVRSPDVDDLLLNTLGTALGFALWRMCLKGWLGERFRLREKGI